MGVRKERSQTAGALRDLRLLGADSGVDVGELAGVEAEDVVLDAAELPEEEEQEERARDDVEDAVPDHLRRRRDDVRALGHGPADRVREEHEAQEACRDEVAAREGAAGRERRAWAVDEEDIPRWHE